jgi:hypothetical protein
MGSVVFAVAGFRSGDHFASENGREPTPPEFIRLPFCTTGAGTTGAVGASVPSCADAGAIEHSPATAATYHRFMIPPPCGRDASTHRVSEHGRREVKTGYDREERKFGRTRRNRQKLPVGTSAGVGVTYVGGKRRALFRS